MHLKSRLCGERLEAAGFLLPIDDIADHASSQLSVLDLEGIRLVKVQTEILCQRLQDLDKATGDSTTLVTEALQRADRGAGAWSQLDGVSDFL